MLILMHAYLYIRNSIRDTTQHDGHHLFLFYITSIGLTLYSNAYDDLRLCVLFVFFLCSNGLRYCLYLYISRYLLRTRTTVSPPFFFLFAYTAMI